MQKSCLLAILLLILPPHNAIAETAEEKGLAIAVEADELDTTSRGKRGFGHTGIK